jgi:hypothetical protein
MLVISLRSHFGVVVGNPWCADFVDSRNGGRTNAGR